MPPSAISAVISALGGYKQLAPLDKPQCNLSRSPGRLIVFVQLRHVKAVKVVQNCPIYKVIPQH